MIQVESTTSEVVLHIRLSGHELAHLEWFAKDNNLDGIESAAATILNDALKLVPPIDL